MSISCGGGLLAAAASLRNAICFVFFDDMLLLDILSRESASFQLRLLLMKMLVFATSTAACFCVADFACLSRSPREFLTSFPPLGLLPDTSPDVI